jgi:hypothetical protein
MKKIRRPAVKLRLNSLSDSGLYIRSGPAGNVGKKPPPQSMGYSNLLLKYIVLEMHCLEVIQAAPERQRGPKVRSANFQKEIMGKQTLLDPSTVA